MGFSARLAVGRPVVLLLVAGAAACTDVSLYGKVGQQPDLPDKIAFTGVLCTDNPATRKFPVKILFIVDASGQMSEAAPLNEHVEAIEQILNEHLPIQNVTIGVIRYDNNALQLISERLGRVTSGFTRDADLIGTAVDNLRNVTGARDLPSAISLARSIVTGDAFQSERGPLSRTKYVIVHITSGSPEPPIPNSDPRCAIFATPPPICEVAYLERQVQELRDEILALGAAELTFNTVYVEQPHIEGRACDPRPGQPITCPAGFICVPAGIIPDYGRCTQLCVTSADCTLSTAPICATTALPDGTMPNYCARGETNCFDGLDNDRDGRALDCGAMPQDLERYPYGCGGLGGCEDDCRSACRTEKLGITMSLAGGGRYQRFSSSDRVNYSLIDFRSTQRRFVLKEFLVFNRNALPVENRLVPDTDADGLSDDEESRLGLDPREPDSDGDFFNDKLEHTLRTLGLDPTRTTTIADCDDPSVDTDGDGLRDCEEKLLASDKTLFDTDADGFPDHVEFRVGTNVLFNDNLDDIDLDGINNGREIRAHTDVLSNDADTRSELGYRVRITDLNVTQDQRSCYDVRVSNVTLVDTLDRGFGRGINDIDIYFGQVPHGALESFGLFHVAQVRVQYLVGPPATRIPDTGAIDLEEGDFVFFEQ